MAKEGMTDEQVLEVCERLWRGGEKLTVKRLREECGIRTERAMVVLRHFLSNEENKDGFVALDPDVALETAFERIRAVALDPSDRRIQAIARAHTAVAEANAREAQGLKAELLAAQETAQQKDRRIADFEGRELAVRDELAREREARAALEAEKAVLLGRVAALNAMLAYGVHVGRAVPQSSRAANDDRPVEPSSQASGLTMTRPTRQRSPGSKGTGRTPPTSRPSGQMCLDFGEIRRDVEEKDTLESRSRHDWAPKLTVPRASTMSKRMTSKTVSGTDRPFMHSRAASQSVSPAGEGVNQPSMSRGTCAANTESNKAPRPTMIQKNVRILAEDAALVQALGQASRAGRATGAGYAEH
jgi:hypothetical protein